MKGLAAAFLKLLLGEQLEPGRVVGLPGCEFLKLGDLF